jgi:nitrous oxide reductase
VTHEPQTDSLATRRGMLAGVGLVGLASAITACGASGSSSSTPAATTPGGSQYSIKTGDVVAGPAPTPLPARQIKVSGGDIFLE